MSGKGEVRIETPSGHVEIVSSARELDPSLWRGAFPGRRMDARYYEAVEAAMGGAFAFRYAILENHATGERLVQPLFLVEQEITAGLPLGLRSVIVAAVRWWPDLLKLKMLVVGCAVGEGELASVEPWALEALQTALEEYARRERAPLVVFKDFPAEYREALGWLRGFRRLASMPSTRLKLGFSSFAEYAEEKLSRNIRSNLHRKLRDCEKRAHLTLEVVNDVSGNAEEVFALYRKTQSRSEYLFERLTEEYFTELGRRLPERTRYFLWRKEGRLMAFALCLVDGKVLRYLNLGMDYPEALELHLYFRVWHDLVEWAIAEKMEEIQAGQLNYEVKARLGLNLLPLDLYVRSRATRFGGILGLALPFLAPARHLMVLRRFPNFREV